MTSWFAVTFIGLLAISGSGHTITTTVDGGNVDMGDVSKLRSMWKESLPRRLTNARGVQGKTASPGFLPHRLSENALASERDNTDSWGVVGTLSLLVNATADIYNHIAVDVAYDGLFGEVLTFPERRPRMFNVILATVKTMLADLIVQVIEHKTQRRGRWAIDWWRAAAFALFGFFYEGLVNWFLYVTVFTQMFPETIRFANSPLALKLANRAGQWQVLGQVLIDNLVCSAFIYFPVFYIIKEALMYCQHSGRPNDKQAEKLGAVETSMDGSLASRAIQLALSKYLGNFKEDNAASCAIWIPLDFVMFSLPMYMRMPFGHVVSFSWLMMLSYMRGAIH